MSKIIFIAGALFLSLLACASEAATFYVDSSSCNTVEDGLTPGTAWKTLAQVNASTFLPGDVIAFKRGTTYTGSLQPRGSGSPGSPITIGVYGAAPTRPCINGGSAQAAVRLFNQQHWHIQGLEITGGFQYGVHISGNQPGGSLSHFRLTDLVVHDSWGTPRWDSGLVVIIPYATGLLLHDVVVDNVHAYNSNYSYGIHVGFNFWSGGQVDHHRSTDVTVRNCTVHDVYGDNITVSQTNGVLIENNVAYRGGLAPEGISYSPNAIWTWSCDNTLVQYNEVYDMRCFSTWDGGAFDVDWGSTNTVIQYNYAHGNQGFAVSVYGLHGTGTVNSVIRYNIFSHNGDEEILVAADGGGWVDGVEIYGNTISSDRSALWEEANSGSGVRANFFRNNIITSSEARLLKHTGLLAIDHNLGWYTGSESPEWSEAYGMFADPLLVDPDYQAIGRPLTAFTLAEGSPAIDAGLPFDGMGEYDFFGNALPPGGPITIGAYHMNR